MTIPEQPNLNSLQLHRLVPASPDRVFNAWTEPGEMKKWWGPKGVQCLSVDIDLRIGGKYKIANELPDGSVIWISGQFVKIKRPRLLIYTWGVEDADSANEIVTVSFEPHDQGTNVTITHEQIATRILSEQHRQGWIGCMGGLAAHFQR